jgi:pimeloyl-ACP methyl ester carboxylesterase
MIQEARGNIDYEETGTGPTMVLVPGSCSTGAAWRPMIAAWDNRFRCVTTSLPGYGGTAERRIPGNSSISLEAETLESVIRRAGSRVHLVGHSFGGLVALAVALRGHARLASLTVIEAPAVMMLDGSGEMQHIRAFGEMTGSYFAAFRDGKAEAIEALIDFFAGAGTFASWPPRVRAYAMATTPVNILDWETAFDYPLTAEVLAQVEVPTLVIRGGESHPAMQRVNEILSERMTRATLATIEGAAHFMIATHADEVARLVAQHAHYAEAASAADIGAGFGRQATGLRAGKLF